MGRVRGLVPFGLGYGLHERIRTSLRGMGPVSGKQGSNGWENFSQFTHW